MQRYKQLDKHPNKGNIKKTEKTKKDVVNY